MLVDDAIEFLPDTGYFKYPNLVRFRTTADGSCLIHSVLNAFYRPYRTGMTNGKAIDRSKLVRDMRSKLAKRLAEPIDPDDPNSKCYYDILYRGSLREQSKLSPEFSLENMQNVLNSSESLGAQYIEPLADVLNVDIHIIDIKKMDVYIIERGNSCLIKNRDSVVIGYIDGHFELIGVAEGDNYHTYFKPNNPLIKSIRDRLLKLTPGNNKHQRR